MCSPFPGRDACHFRVLGIRVGQMLARVPSRGLSPGPGRAHTRTARRARSAATILGRWPRCPASSSSCTTRRRCTSTSACSPARCCARGPCPKGLRSTRRSGGWPCRSRTTPWRPVSSRACTKARRGSGAVIIWDEGPAEIVRDEPGHLSFVPHGSKLAGGFALTRTGRRRWILVKVRDEDARPARTSSPSARPASGAAGPGRNCCRRASPKARSRNDHRGAVG